MLYRMDSDSKIMFKKKYIDNNKLIAEQIKSIRCFKID